MSMLFANNALIKSVVEGPPPPSCVVNDPPPSAVTSSANNGMPAVRTMAVQFTNTTPIDTLSSVGCFSSFGQIGEAFIWLYHGGNLSGAMTDETMAFFKTNTQGDFGHTYIKNTIPAGTHTIVMASDLSSELAWVDGNPATVYQAVGSTRTDYNIANQYLTAGARSLSSGQSPAYDSYTPHKVHRAVASSRLWGQADVDLFVSGGTPASTFDPGCPFT